MDVLIASLLSWLAQATDLNAVGPAPTVQFASSADLAELRYAGLELQARRDVVGLYVDETRTILLTEGWDAGDPADVSALVHELVHHLQNDAGARYWCSGEREAEAYAVQAEWLAQFDMTLESEFGLDPVTLELTTTCFYP